MREARTSWGVQIKARAAAQVFLERCARERIDALPVKGVLTARLLYADIAERRMLDVDVRVRPRDLERAVALADRVLGRVRVYRSAMIEVGGMQIDLETSVGPPGLCDLSVEQLLERAQESDLLNFPHLLPEIHDHAIVLAVNVFKDKLSLAMHHALEDARRIGRLIDPPTLARRARDTGSATLLWLVADHFALEEPRWAATREALGPPSRPRYATLVQSLERLQTGPRGSAGSLPLRVVARLANDHPTRRIEALARMVGWTLERRLARGR